MNKHDFMASSQNVYLSRQAALRTLGHEDLFSYLCMHGALHWWYELRWLADIGALLAVTPWNRIERLNSAARARGAGRAAAQAMLLCQRLLGTTFPAGLLKELNQSPHVRGMQGTALKFMANKRPQDLRFGTTRGNVWAFFLGEGWRYRFAELRRILLNETDILALPLPKCLYFLYPLLRVPLWLLRNTRKNKM